jgi:biopolymer transport protein ExbB
MNLTHAFEQGNTVLITVFLLLIGMSLASWYVIFWKAMSVRNERALLKNFREQRMQTPDWARHALTQQNSSEKGAAEILLSEAARLQPSIATYDAAQRRDLLGMHLSQKLDTLRTGFDRGLTLLASVGSSSPFIGLFGTVWGIYGALLHISAEGNATLNAVAGPMGEALVATAIGLFAAIPAVLAYNAYVRINRVLVQDLRHIAEQLTAYLTLPAAANNTDSVRLVR